MTIKQILAAYASGRRNFANIKCNYSARPWWTSEQEADNSFVGKKLDGICFFGHAQLYLASLINADFSGAHFEDANLTESDFRGSNLTGAHFSRSILYGTDFRGANLTGAVFCWAKFQGTDFRDANMTETKFVDCEYGVFPDNQMTELDQAIIDRTTASSE